MIPLGYSIFRPQGTVVVAVRTTGGDPRVLSACPAGQGSTAIQESQ